MPNLGFSLNKTFHHHHIHTTLSNANSRILLKNFRAALLQLPGVQEEQHFLLAVSGGKDSTVLADLFFCAGFSITIAHCNFQLRGAEADADEVFVQQLAARYEAPFFSTRFETAEFAETKKISIQAAARWLRYEWLENLRVAEGLDWIVTAHHANDNVETILYNFTKGTGLAGLLGIPAVNGKVIRPLLGFTREELEQYYLQEELEHREDRSNAEVYYARNRIRQQVVPTLKIINPHLEHSVSKNLPFLQEIALFFELEVQRVREKYWTERHGVYFFAVEVLKDHPAAGNLLHRLLQPFNFTSDQIGNLLQAIKNGQPGKFFYSEGYQMLLDCVTLVIEKKREANDASIWIPADQFEVSLPSGLFILVYHQEPPTTYSVDVNTAWIDSAELRFPLELRHWRAGDVFCPLGMGGRRRKLQNFLSDQKIDRFTKKNLWLLVNADGRIIWVVGFRLDERFKIQDSTTTTVEIKITDFQNPKT